jgi:hypothetical protein
MEFSLTTGPEHEPSHLSAAWLGAIAAAVSATMATVTVAWPHIQPLLHNWLQNHSGFMSRAEILIKEALAPSDDPALNAAIQARLDLFLEEAAELQRAVYAALPVSAKTPASKSAA